MVRLILAGVALAACAMPAWGQERMSREQTFHRSGSAGQELRVFTYGRWHQDCTAMEPPQLVLRTAPAHGTVSFRPGPTRSTRLREGAPDCTGNIYPGLGVWYVPTPGFHGVDQFEWDVIGGTSISHDSAVVEIR
ncbi:MAG: hypothetical protein JO264_10650 [Acidisphaera sp.]|nr:hypothetical protein [Acidisphaera sp.]